MRKKYKDEVDIPENVEIAKMNSDIKRLPLFSHYIWTHDIHSLVKVEEPKHWNDEENRLHGVKSQPYLERGNSTSILKKSEDHESEEEKNKKNSRKKNTSAEKLTGYLEKLDNWHLIKKPDGFICQKVNEMALEVTSRKKAGVVKFQELYNELFGCKQDLMPSTSRRNQEFIEKIRKIQEEIRPDLQKLPSIYENINVKQGSKTKPTKVLGN